MLILYHIVPYLRGDEFVLLVGHQTFNLHVVGSSPGLAPLHNGFGQVTSTCVPLSPSGIIYRLVTEVPAKGCDLFGWESNHGHGGK